MKAIYSILFIVAATLVLAGCSQEESPTGESVSQTTTAAGNSLGNLAPDFTVTNTNNQQISLADLRGKPTLIYFWASWCPSCSKDFSVLKDIYPEYEDKVKIVAIDLDLKESNEVAAKYKNKYPPLEAVNFAAGNKDVLTKYGVRYTTTKYAVKSDGTILYKGSGVFTKEQWRTLLDALSAS